MPHIFERFYKSDDEKNRKGTGLGLAIAKHIADRHGISINVESEQGEITKFTFVFG
jgi:signal transduction histidine kinase